MWVSQSVKSAFIEADRSFDQLKKLDKKTKYHHWRNLLNFPVKWDYSAPFDVVSCTQYHHLGFLAHRFYKMGLCHRRSWLLSNPEGVIDRLKPILKLTENPNPQTPTPTPPTPPQRGITFSQPNRVGSSSNFQDIFLTIYQHDLWCQMSPFPAGLKSGTINVLQASNLGFLSQIMYNLNQTFNIFS